MKAYQDITNIEIYRWLLMQNELRAFDPPRVQLELWVPGSGESDIEHVCKWMNGLSVVQKSARKIIAAYAQKLSFA